jgi:hypothetical protein
MSGGNPRINEAIKQVETMKMKKHDVMDIKTRW